MQGLFIQHLRHGRCGVFSKHIIIPNFDRILQGKDFPSKDCVGRVIQEVVSTAQKKVAVTVTEKGMPLFKDRQNATTIAASIQREVDMG